MRRITDTRYILVAWLLISLGVTAFWALVAIATGAV